MESQRPKLQNQEMLLTLLS